MYKKEYTGCRMMDESNVKGRKGDFEKAFRLLATLYTGSVDSNVSRLASRVEKLLELIASYAPEQSITVSDGRFNLTIAKNRVSVSTADGISSLSGVKLIEFAKALPFLLELYVKKLKEIEREVAELDEKVSKLIYGLEAVLKIV
ncbi:hypothetical protein AFULGI_00016080 [Archaeoglobus fulgidus DSM 8774]|uniref:Uncharacterized protein n=1 Tax=Archaeoglobus fulgidus DSM 8774 TaxID=1344584 RepID=A0A075WD57_ARCFL|nr:hypothetical protein [Archaeoglobus fulgidus]AIG98370.1 hypothetical protein AFULGI_00016080 [Archaeoglobus fulgidus DSM 8774]